MVAILPAMVLMQMHPAHAQQRKSDSLEFERAISSERRDLPFSASARFRLLRGLREGDLPGVRGLLQFMDRRSSADSYGWLAPTERLLAEALLSDTLLIRDLSRLESLLAAARTTERQNPAFNDGLHRHMRDLLRERSEGAIGRFAALEPMASELWFFNLLVNHLYIRGLRAQEDLNGRVEEFARKMPGAPLVRLAETYIWKRYSESDFGAAFSAGYSLGGFDGALGEHFGSFHGPSLAGELYLWKWSFAGNITFGVAEALDEFAAGGERWKKGDAPFINGSLSAGYEFRFGRLAVTPFAGLAMQSVRGDDSAGIESALLPRTRDRVGYELGAIVGYRIPSDIGTHIDLRARFGRTATGLSSYDPGFSGALWYIQFAFALVQRPYDPR